MFFGTITNSISTFYNLSITLAVDWALNASHPKGFLSLWHSIFFFHLFDVWDQNIIDYTNCFNLITPMFFIAEIFAENLCRKLTFGGDLSVLPVHMSYNRRIIPSNDSQFWARSLVVSDLRSETKCSRFESGC